MGAWFVMSAMGLFSMDGGTSVDPVFELGTPLFSKITIRPDNRFYDGKPLTIETRNLSQESIYIRSATLNGRKLDQLRIRWADLVKGGTLVIETDVRE
jgi:putative alpha-1,2-mannosidase